MYLPEIHNDDLIIAGKIDAIVGRNAQVIWKLFEKDPDGIVARTIVDASLILNLAELQEPTCKRGVGGL